MKKLLFVAGVISIITRGMDLADVIVNQYELHNQTAAQTQLTSGDHHKELAQLIRSSDPDGLRKYINLNKAAITPDLFNHQPSLERLAKQQHEQGLFHQQAPYGAKAIFAGLASVAGTGMLAPCAFNKFSYHICQEPVELSLLTVFSLGCLSYACYSVRNMMIARAPKNTDAVIAIINSLKEELFDLEHYPKRPKTHSAASEQDAHPQDIVL